MQSIAGPMLMAYASIPDLGTCSQHPPRCHQSRKPRLILARVPLYLPKRLLASEMGALHMEPDSWRGGENYCSR
jgi:hypothetical protein